MSSRFVDDFISEQENKSTALKTQRDVKLLQLFLVNKNERRNIKDTSIEALNEYVSDFIIWVRTKDGKEYERFSLRNLLQASSDITRRTVTMTLKPFLYTFNKLCIFQIRIVNFILTEIRKCVVKIKLFMHIYIVFVFTASRHLVESLTTHLNKTIKI